MRLASHAEPLHQGRRRRVARVALAGDAVEAKPLEPHAQHDGGSFDPIALALVVRVDCEADLALQMVSARAPAAEVANQRFCSLEERGETKGIAAPGEIRHARDARQPLADVVGRPGLPVEVAAHVLATVDRDHRVQVVVLERPEGQSLGEDREWGGHCPIIEDVASGP